VTSVISGSTGVYVVTWNRVVASCGYMVSPLVISGDAPGGRFATTQHTAASDVTVRTFDSFGNPFASAFTVSLICP
jgi:hypothetical protein